MKKTDFELFKEMLERAEIEYDESETEDNCNMITLEARKHVNGYSGFKTDFLFDTNTGALQNIEIYE